MHVVFGANIVVENHKLNENNIVVFTCARWVAQRPRHGRVAGLRRGCHSNDAAAATAQQD